MPTSTKSRNGAHRNPPRPRPPVEEWPAKPKVPGPPEPEPLPPATLPTALRDWVSSVARSVQAPVDIAVLLALSVISAAVAGKVVVRPDDAYTQEWVALYGVVLAPPGERKSQVFGHMSEPVYEWQEARRQTLEEEHREAWDVVEAREIALKQAKRRRGITAEELRACRQELEEARARAPIMPELVAHDSTPEALVQQMASQGGRVAVLSPEGGPLRILDGRYSEAGARLEELAQGYDGERIIQQRVGSDDRTVRRPALTLGLALQPSVLDTIAHAHSLKGQGIFGRISWVYPRSLVGTREDSTLIPALDTDAQERYRETLWRLLDLPAAEVENDGTPVPYVLDLSDDARAVKRAYHDEVEPAMGQGGSLATMQDWAGKAVGRAIRIAALLELARRAVEGLNPVDGPISAESMTGAVELCRALTTHAQRVYRYMEADKEERDLIYLLRRLQENTDLRTQAELLRAVQGRKSIKDGKHLAELLSHLEDRGCIRRKSQASKGRGRPPSPSIELHPGLQMQSAENGRNS